MTKAKRVKFHVAIQDFLKHVGNYMGAQPCTSEQVEEIMARQGVSRLPDLYDAYLLKCGNYPKNKPEGIWLDYPGVLEAKDLALTFLAHDKPQFTLSKDAFVFSTYGEAGDYWNFLYFHTDEHPIDPIVYELTSDYDAPQLFNPIIISRNRIATKFLMIHTLSSTFIPIIIDDLGGHYANPEYLDWYRLIHNLQKIPIKPQANRSHN